MKKLIIYFPILFLACKKSGPSTGTLTVTVFNPTNGMPLEGFPDEASVYIYTNLQNFGNPNDAFQNAFIDKNGVATFPGIPVGKYYFFAEDSCGTSSGYDSATIGSIIGGTTNGYFTTISIKFGCIP